MGVMGTVMRSIESGVELVAALVVDGDAPVAVEPVPLLTVVVVEPWA